MTRLVKTVYFWIVALGSTVVFYLLCFVAHIYAILKRKPKDGRLPHYFASLWGKTIIRLMPGWKVYITGREHLVADGTSSIIVANHESMADIWAMYYLGVQFRWLSKKQVFDLPLVGQAMRWARYVSVDRANRQSGMMAMRESADRLNMGLAMFFFPEGTRSIDGKIKNFKLGAFRLAFDTKSRVQPIAIHGAGELLRKGSVFPSDKAEVRIRVLPALPPPESEASLEAYAEIVRQMIITAHNDLCAQSNSQDQTAT